MIGFDSAFRCPVCGDSLIKREKSLYCSRGHCYDYAKSGYVNLLMSQQGRLHGDDRPMVRARTAFLSQGYYFPLLECISDALSGILPNNARIVDAGCGEGWYLEELTKRFPADLNPEIVGIDISKDALSIAARRPMSAEFAVGSLYHIPLADGWANLVLNIFAPDSFEEFSRILTDGGFVLKVIPLEDHLIELKRAVYDSVYENEVSVPSPEGVVLRNRTDLRLKIFLKDNAAIQALFAMTPYVRKTSPDDIAKLNSLASLETTAAFSLLLYQKTGC